MFSILYVQAQIERPGNEVERPGNEVERPGIEVERPGNEVGRHGNEVGRSGNETIHQMKVGNNYTMHLIPASSHSVDS